MRIRTGEAVHVKQRDDTVVLIACELLAVEVPRVRVHLLCDPELTVDGLCNHKQSLRIQTSLTSRSINPELDWQ